MAKSGLKVTELQLIKYWIKLYHSNWYEMKLKDTKIVFHETVHQDDDSLFILSFCFTFHHSYTRPEDAVPRQEKVSKSGTLSSKFDLWMQFWQIMNKFGRFHACSSSNPKILARNLFTLSSNILFNSILEDILPCSLTLFLVLCCSTNKRAGVRVQS